MLSKLPAYCCKHRARHGLTEACSLFAPHLNKSNVKYCWLKVRPPDIIHIHRSNLAVPFLPNPAPTIIFKEGEWKQLHWAETSNQTFTDDGGASVNTGKCFRLKNLFLFVSLLPKQKESVYSATVSICARILLCFVTSSFAPQDVKRIISSRESSNQTHSVCQCDCVSEGEPVACVVNSSYFQQSLTWGNLTLSLDPVWVIRACVVCMCVYDRKMNASDYDWSFPAETGTALLYLKGNTWLIFYNVGICASAVRWEL